MKYENFFSQTGRACLEFTWSGTRFLFDLWRLAGRGSVRDLGIDAFSCPVMNNIISDLKEIFSSVRTDLLRNSLYSAL